MIPLKKYLESLMAYAQKNMQFSHPPKWELDSSADEGVFRKTAHYNPGNETITIFTLNRHPKDVLRSFSHELVHHTQNLRGDLSPEKCGDLSLGYAQNNKHMRDMEAEAYLNGNLCFRDWEDICKKRLSESIIKNYKEKIIMNRGKLEEMIRDLVKERINSKKESTNESMEISDQTREAVMGAIVDALKGLGSVEKGELVTQLQRPSDSEEESTSVDSPEDEEEVEVVAQAVSAGSVEGGEDLEEGGCSKARGHDEKDTKVMDEGEEAGDKKETSPPKKPGEDCCGEDSCGHRGAVDEAGLSSKQKKVMDTDGDNKITGKDLDGLRKENKYKITTPEQENSLYESRFGKRNDHIFDKLTRLWAK